ncbi:MAG: nucleotidyltransferase family protein [Beijerinckiaceae bacterium]|nr:nucleotidyltransferase family protein [Beijerinckiaceae bacterium]
MRLGAIILAAGQSSRFEDGHKLLTEFHCKPILAHVLGLAREYPLADCVVVTGARREGVEALAAEAGMRIVHNPDFADGLSTSLKAGIASLPAEIDGAFILLGDMPLIARETLQALDRAAQNAPEKAAFVPVFGAEWAHPVLLMRKVLPDLQHLSGDQGARKLLQARKDVALVPVEDPGSLADIDTRADLARAAGPNAASRT